MYLWDLTNEMTEFDINSVFGGGDEYKHKLFQLHKPINYTF